MNRVSLDKIIAVIEPLLTPLGFECLDVYWLKDGTLQVFIDKLDGSEVGLDDCVGVNRALDEDGKLDAMFADQYNLEVSSPGIERPLRSRAHFAKHIGDVVEVKLEKKILDRVHGKGKVLAVTEGGEVTLETSRGEWIFPLNVLQRASLVHDW